MKNVYDRLSVSMATPGDEVPIGTITRDTSGFIKFDVDESYIHLGSSRPTLSTAWVQAGDEQKTIERLRSNQDKVGGHGQLPPWFSGLLPEGALRSLIETGMPTGKTGDFDVLEWLGGDLPGAVIIKREEGRSQVLSKLPPVQPATASVTGVRFSLAGVQMKLSMLKREESLTLPAEGERGAVIAKLPSAKIPWLPEVEYTSMKLAEAVGVSIPELYLVRTTAITGIPDSLLDSGEHVLSVNRYDRTEDGRIHVEDFAQIIGAVGDRKYTMANEETVMKMATKFSHHGARGFKEAITRITVNILLGNTDAHLKNWSLIYRDGVTPELTPAYDIVAFAVYDNSDQLALRFRGTRDASIIGLNRFVKAGALCGFGELETQKHVLTTIEKAADMWPKLLKDLPMPEQFQQLLVQRLQRLTLWQKAGVKWSL